MTSSAEPPVIYHFTELKKSIFTRHTNCLFCRAVCGSYLSLVSHLGSHRAIKITFQVPIQTIVVSKSPPRLTRLLLDASRECGKRRVFYRKDGRPQSRPDTTATKASLVKVDAFARLIQKEADMELGEISDLNESELTLMCKWNATALSLSWHRLQLPLVASQFTVANLGDTLADGNAKNTFICLLANFVQLGLLSKGHMKRILDKMASPELMQID